jgi:hypothetical protein
MSKYGLKIAKEFGKKLPEFPNYQEAERHLFAWRDEHLALLERIAEHSTSFIADYSAASLKKLEAWYFELWENNSFEKLQINRETFERCMSFYFGEVANRNGSAKWIVEEYAFGRGKYEIGVRSGLTTIMLGRFTDLFETPSNKRRQSIYRQYQQYFA